MLWLQNNFLRIRFEPKIFIANFFVKNIYGCKIISSKAGLHQTFHQKYLVENFLWLQYHFLESRFAPKFLIKNFLVENDLWLYSLDHFTSKHIED